jgi:hypothetical protein
VVLHRLRPRLLMNRQLTVQEDQRDCPQVRKVARRRKPTAVRPSKVVTW